MKSQIIIVFVLYGVDGEAAAKDALENASEIKHAAESNSSIDADFSIEWNEPNLYIVGDRRVVHHVAQSVFAFYHKHKLQPSVYLGDHANKIPWHMTYEDWIKKEADLETVLNYFRSKDQDYRHIHYTKVAAIKPLLEVVLTLCDVQQGRAPQSKLNDFSVRELGLANKIIDAYFGKQK